MPFQLAELFVSITAKDSQLKTALKSTHDNLIREGGSAGEKGGEAYGKAFSNAVKTAMSGVSKAAGIGGLIGGAVSGLVVQAAGAVWGKLKETWHETVDEAKDLARVMRILQFTVGDNAKGMEEWATKTSESVGIPKIALLEAADKFAVMGLRQNMSRKEAANFGMEMARLAGDIQSASIEGISFETATQKIFRGAMGGTRGLREMGISITQLQTQHQALAMGFVKVNGQFRQTDLAMARIALISKNLGLAQGDLASRAGTAGLVTKQTSQIWANMYEEVGKMLLPAVKEWTFAQYEFALSVKDAFQQARPYIEKFADSMSEGWKNIKSIVLPIVQSVKSTISSFAGSLFNAISPGTAALTGLSLAALAIGPPVVTFLSGLALTTAPIVAGVVVLYKAYEYAGPYIARFANTVISYWPMIRNAVTNTVDVAIAKWGEFTTWLSASWEASTPALYSAWDTVQTTFYSFIDGLKAGFEILKDDWNVVSEAVASAANRIFGSVGIAFGGGSLTTVRGFGTIIKDWIADKLDLAAFALRNIGPLAEIGFLKAYQSVVNFGHNVAGTFKNIHASFLSLPIGILGAFSSVANGIGSILESIAGGFKILVDKVLDGLKVFMQYAVGPVIDAMHAVGLTEKTGVNFMDDLIEGEKEMAGKFNVSGLFKNMASGADSAKESLKKMQKDLWAEAASPPADVTSARIGQIYGDIAKTEKEHTERVQKFTKDRKKAREDEWMGEDEEAAFVYYNELDVDEEARYADEKKRGKKKRDVGERAEPRRVQPEEYPAGQAKVVDSASFMQSVQYALIGGVQDQQLAALLQLVENTKGLKDQKEDKKQFVLQ